MQEEPVLFLKHLSPWPSLSRCPEHRALRSHVAVEDPTFPLPAPQASLALSTALPMLVLSHWGPYYRGTF